MLEVPELQHMRSGQDQQTLLLNLQIEVRSCLGNPHVPQNYIPGQTLGIKQDMTGISIDN